MSLFLRPCPPLSVHEPKWTSHIKRPSDVAESYISSACKMSYTLRYLHRGRVVDIIKTTMNMLKTNRYHVRYKLQPCQLRIIELLRIQIIWLDRMPSRGHPPPQDFTSSCPHHQTADRVWIYYKPQSIAWIQLNRLWIGVCRFGAKNAAPTVAILVPNKQQITSPVDAVLFAAASGDKVCNATQNADH